MSICFDNIWYGHDMDIRLRCLPQPRPSWCARARQTASHQVRLSWRLGWEGASEWSQIWSAWAAWAAWAAWHSALILLLFVPEMKRKREGVYYNGNYHKANCHVYDFLSISESRELESASAISCCRNRVVHEESKWTLCSVCNKKDKVALRPRNPLLYSLERQ